MDDRFNVASTHRHHKAHVGASRAFPGIREFVQKLRAVRGRGWLRCEPESLGLPQGHTLVHVRVMAGDRLDCNKLVIAVNGGGVRSSQFSIQTMH